MPNNRKRKKLELSPTGGLLGKTLTHMRRVVTSLGAPPPLPQDDAARIAAAVEKRIRKQEKRRRS